MILPGSTVKVTDENSIYRGYVGCVQRIQGKKAAVLMKPGEMQFIFIFFLAYSIAKLFDIAIIPALEAV